MKHLLFSAILASVFLVPSKMQGQIVTTTPAIIQTDTKNITITYHANLGNKGLMGLASTVPVYAHTGVITDKSDGAWAYAPTWLTNTAKYQLKYVAANTYELTIPDISTYYGVPAGETVEQLCFVFRDATGSKEGKTENGGDIFVDVLPAGYQALISTDLPGNVITSSDPVNIKVNVTSPSSIELFVNNQRVASQTNTTELQYSRAFTTAGDYEIKAVTMSGTNTVTKVLNLVRLSQSVAENYPGGVPKMGPVRQDNGDVIFCIAAPQKNSVTLVGSWNDYNVTIQGQMKYQDYQGNRYFWTKVSGLKAATDYIYYFVVDGETSVGDPYARLVLDPWNDQHIPASVFPNLPAYPVLKVQQVPLAVYNTKYETYDWQIKDFKGVDQSELIIYELLIRDFTGTEGQAKGDGTVKGVIEKLDYLKGLGVNAIELLPIMEFNGNLSWGYNTNFYFAPDKAYGTPDDYRRLIDECHKRGMAVILDIVFNQSDGLHPWYQMYPIAKNPFYNGSAPHAYSVLNDWNQDNALVQQQWHDALKFWLEAYNVDGFRFDLVKGLGNNDSYGSKYNASTNTWTSVTDANTNKYNATRVARMKTLHDAMRTVKPDAYFINENLATAQEENQMAQDGETNWANINDASCQFAMGYSSNSNLNRFYAPLDSRTWGSTVSYAESHDEERMAYKVSKYGAAGIKGNIPITMRRLGSVAAQMLMAPGAHMIWQFQEFGADQTTKNAQGNDTGNKKVVWSYLDNPDRAGLAQCYRELNAIRNGNPQMFKQGVTTTVNCNVSNWDNGRTIRLVSGDSEILLVVNPTTSTKQIATGISKDPSNYQVLSKSYNTNPVISSSKTVSLMPGAYAVFGTNNLSHADNISADGGKQMPVVFAENGTIIIGNDYKKAEVYNVSGQKTGMTGLASGLYIVVVDGTAVKVMVP